MWIYRVEGWQNVKRKTLCCALYFSMLWCWLLSMFSMP